MPFSLLRQRKAKHGPSTLRVMHTLTFEGLEDRRMLANNAPAGADKTIITLEDTAYTFAAADFGFSDPSDSPANNLLAVQITTLPARGTLVDTGVAATVNQ